MKDTHFIITGAGSGIGQALIASNAKVSHTQDPRQVAADLEKFERESLINTAEYAAQVIMKGIEKGKPRILIGRDAKIIDILARTFPSTYHLKIPKALTERAKIH